MPISIEKLKEIDTKLDSFIPQFDLLKIDKELALISILNYYEEYISLETTAKSRDSVQHNSISKNAQDGFDFAIQWIFKYCPNDKNKKVGKSKLREYAKSLLEKSQEYSRVWDFMNLAFREISKVHLQNENTLLFEYKDDYLADADIANMFHNMTDDYDSILDEISSTFELDPNQIFHDINPKINSNGNLVYNISDSVFIKVYYHHFNSKNHLLTLDENWDLGGYKVKDLHHFFYYLRTISSIHIILTMFLSIKRKIRINMYVKRKEDEWINDICRNIEISETACKTIFSELVYNYNLYNISQNPDVTYQPLIPFSNGDIILVNSLAQQSNFERNHWALLSIIKPTLHSQLRNKKEQLWRCELEASLSRIGLNVKGPIKFVFQDQQSDIDLIILDESRKVILLIELKWINSPDRIKDIIYLNEELKKGLKQVEFALEYCKNEPSDFIMKTQFNKTDLKDYKFYGIVLSKNSMGNGFTFNEMIPILNERIFKWILFEPHQKDIETLWKIGIEKRYMPQENVHYKSTDFDAYFGSYKFIGKGIGAKMIRPFNPLIDFNFIGL